jgi:hypothetical protein
VWQCIIDMHRGKVVHEAALAKVLSGGSSGRLL